MREWLLARQLQIVCCLRRRIINGGSLPWVNWVTKQRPAKVVAPELPLRSELFTVEQLTQHARFLGANHQVATEEGANPLLDRLDENEEIIRKFNLESQAMGQARRLTPAAEWLLDNFYLIEEQTLLARRHLPRRYSRELPRLADGPFPGCPRVYDLVMELISHTDAQLDGERASAFIAAYQTLAPLKMGELWAVPIMLRLGLIENLRRITVRLSEARRERNLAHQWADKLHAVVEREPSQVITVLADLAREGMLMTSPFVTDFCQRLARMPPAVHLVRHWLEQVLGEQGLSTEQLIQMESQKQAADQVSVSHSIASLRFLSALDWKEFVETLSQVNQTLLRDPADIFGKMDFATRDRYRHKVERLARHSTWSESQVAQKAVELAEAANRQPGKSNRPNHVGYYLVDKGQAQLEAAVQVRWPWRDRLERAIGAYPLAFYLGGIGGVTMLATAALAWDAWKLGVMGWPLAGLAILSFICSSQLAISLSNWLSSMLLKPSLLPRLDFAEGIPSDCCTMVVVPTMLTDSEAVAEMLEGLESHYLANRDTNLHFALLTDFSDSIQETAADDAQLVELARAGVVQLNQKYRANRENIFFLLHRPRLWNPAENIWMGYERKRGKLMELNALLRGRGRERFSVIVGDESLLPSIKFVITLDADTQLPRDVGRQLVGTIAHPLNRSEFDPEKGIVSEGYSILQPRVGISLPGANRSWFARLFSGEAGIDPYTHAVSDVYQDLFKEGSFIGKGIYDVDAFEQALQGRFPENSILSHDLIESLHARSGLVTDVEFYEEYPSRYTSDISRRHRWIRGDWQIAPWLLPRVPGADARVIANPLSSLSRWKILDNLRRSLVPGSLILLLLGSWLLFPQLYEVELWVIAVILFLPALLSVSREMLHRSEESPLRLHLKWVGRSLGRQLGQVFLTIVFLPYDTFVSWDAIVRTVVRMAVTRKRLLQWQPARETERLGGSSFVDFVRTMWIGPALAIVAATLILMLQPAVFGTVSPLLLLWLGSPAIAWWISRPMEPAAPKLNARERAFLGRCARKAWRFFETFVNEQENWLPPDNFQEHPAPLVAARTSPTNMGLSLLANLSA
jgi:cyclic beta-1,2-glucan synthetase